MEKQLKFNNIQEEDVVKSVMEKEDKMFKNVKIVKEKLLSFK